MCGGSNDYEINRLRPFLGNGANVQAAFSYCENARLTLAGVMPTWDEYETAVVIMHETYHAVQQDLNDNACNVSYGTSASNRKWIVEGAARYASTINAYSFGLRKQRFLSKSGRSVLLEFALDIYKNKNNTDLKNGSMQPGAAALSLMVQRGELDEKSIFDGSLFWECD